MNALKPSFCLLTEEGSTNFLTSSPEKRLAKEKLTKKQYIATLKKIEKFIDSASIPELKQKGIVKNIINTALGNKSNHIIKGEGKRKRDQEEEEARRKLFENVNPEKNTTANITRNIINCS